MQTWNSLLFEIKSSLSDGDDALRIIEQVSGYSRGELLQNGDEPVNEKLQARVEIMVERRKAGEPLQYVLGSWGFRDLDLFVDQRVLIPRPETEVLVEHALEAMREIPGEVKVVDLGTGSGAVALSIAHENERARVYATDLSPDALSVASANLAGLGTAGTRVQLFEGSWFSPLPVDLLREIHVVVSNPPYIANDEDLPVEVREWEPNAALFSGPTGVEAYEHLFSQLDLWLTDGGVGLFEMAPHQATDLQEMAEACGFLSEVRADLAGKDRIIILRRS